MKPLFHLPALIAGLCLVAPLSGFGKKNDRDDRRGNSIVSRSIERATRTERHRDFGRNDRDSRHRDRDRNHKWRGDRDRHHDHDRHHRYGGRGYYGRSYYGSGYYGYPYGYGYGYGYPYGYGYARPSIGISYVSRSYDTDYYDSGRVYYGRSAARHSDNLAAEVQSELKRRGYYRGPIDGDIGAGSRAAIRAYQADRGLSVTGRIDSALLRSLDVG